MLCNSSLVILEPTELVTNRQQYYLLGYFYCLHIKLNCDKDSVFSSGKRQCTVSYMKFDFQYSDSPEML